ncbi:MAG: hypothetical protein AAFV98_11570 [Chloroflexota bacterium]
MDKRENLITMTSQDQLTYVQLEPNEDIPSVRDRLSFFRGQQVLIIWPEEGTALTRKLDLVLVQREARRRLLQVAFVTHDEMVIIHAEELGISTYETIGAAEKARWKRGRTRVFVQRHHKPDDVAPDELMPVASRVRRTRKRLPWFLRIPMRVGVVGIVIAVLMGTLYVTVPSATVTIAMEQELISVDTTITADPNALDIDVENRVIPATRYEATVSTVQQVTTSGSEEGISTAATGFVSFSNQTDSTIDVPVGTQVSTGEPNPIIFETTAITTVPANSTVDNVPIEASTDYLGSIGNVNASTIDTVLGDLSDDLAVSNTLATTGGNNNDFSTVTADDMDRAMGAARQYLQVLAFTEIEAELNDNQTIIIESLRIPDELQRDDWITYSHTMGDTTDLLSLDIRVIVEALVIDDRFAQQIVFAQVSANKPDDMNLNPESFLYRRGPVVSTDEENRTTFQAFGEGIASAQLNTFALQSDLTGRSIEEAQRLIAAIVDIAPNSQPQIEIFPNNFGFMPLLPVRIDIEVEGTDS